MRISRRIFVGDVPIGGGSPVVVQSMTNTPTCNIDATLKQIHLLVSRGAELVRVAIPDIKSAESLKTLVSESPVPLIADIQFDPDLALYSIEAGVAKLRLNPGNIQKTELIKTIVTKAASKRIPIRIGVNSGSIPGDLRKKFGGVNVDSLWASAERHLRMLEKSNFRDIVISIKASDPLLTIDANRKAANLCDYPLHLGVTEAGPPSIGGVRSATAISILLYEGIGDTIRVSLSGPPENELPAAWEILTSLGIRKRRTPRIVSCPTCSRARIDVASIAENLLQELPICNSDFTIAVMGCEVNGPGEARDADLAVIGTPSGVMLYRKNCEPVRIINWDSGQNSEQNITMRISEILRSELVKNSDNGEVHNGLEK